MKKVAAKMNQKETPIHTSGLFDPGEWMSSRSFMKQLRKDNIDISLIQGELRELCQVQDNLPWRGRLTNILRSNQLQLFLALLVLIDAFIVITEIVLEIHSMKSLKEAYKGQYVFAYSLLSSMFPISKSVSYNDTFPENMTSQDDGSHLLPGEQSTDLSRLLRHIQNELLNDDCSSMQEGAKEFLRQKIHENPSQDSEKSGKILSQASLISPAVTPSLRLMMRRSVESNGLDSSVQFVSTNEAKSVSHEYAHKLHDTSQILHYISIAILGFFLFEVCLKVICLQRKFFREKFELVDAFVITTSFIADILFVLYASQEISVMVVFLLWRIVRVINGLLMHEKQRDEFRISLQKKARRLLEAKYKIMEVDREMLEKHVHALEELCVELGASADQLNACRPRYISHSKDQASHALKSIAALTTGFMGGLVGAQPYNNDKVNRFGSNNSTKRSLTSLKKLGGSRTSVKFENGSLSHSQSTLVEDKVIIGGGSGAGKSSLSGTPHHQEKTSNGHLAMKTKSFPGPEFYNPSFGVVNEEQWLNKNPRRESSNLTHYDIATNEENIKVNDVEHQRNGILRRKNTYPRPRQDVVSGTDFVDEVSHFGVIATCQSTDLLDNDSIIKGPLPNLKSSPHRRLLHKQRKPSRNHLSIQSRPSQSNSISETTQTVFVNDKIKAIEQSAEEFLVVQIAPDHIPVSMSQRLGTRCKESVL